MNDVYRALSDPTRRRILALLRDGDWTAGELQAEFVQSWPTISAHLRVLREADLVQADRHGTSITYHLNVSLLEAPWPASWRRWGSGTRRPAS